MSQKGILIGGWFAGLVSGIIGVFEIASIDEEENSPITAIKTAAKGLTNIMIFSTLMTIVGLSTMNEE